MNNFILAINGKKYIAEKPTVKNLKDFLKFQKDFDLADGFDIDAYKALKDVILSILPNITEDKLEELEVSEFIKSASAIANWMSKAISNEGSSKN